MKVSKFGGTSMGSASAMHQAALIVAGDPARKLVVVSATSGTTNQLLRIDQHSKGQQLAAAMSEVEQLKARHLLIAQQLEMPQSEQSSLVEIFNEVEQYCLGGKRPQASAHHQDQAADQALDELLSVGERLSSLLFVQALKNAFKNIKTSKAAYWQDARLCLRTDSAFGRAEPNPALTFESSQALRARLQQPNEVWVTQGFIGSDAQGRTTTLGRGGSDYSAALFAEAVGATEVEIWTDVPGIMTMDPNVVKKAKVLPELRFSEAAEMATLGAKVLHPSTLWPAIRAQIPVFVGSTFNPQAQGTRIYPENHELWKKPAPHTTPLIRAIALRKRQILITAVSLRMLNAHGFLAKFFEIFARYQISVDLVTTSEVSVALTVDEVSQGGSGGKTILDNAELFAELKAIAEITVEENLTLVAIIGNRLNQIAGVASRVFQSISDFNLRLICHGASEHNICFLISSSHADDVSRRLHSVCIEDSAFEALE